jgi:hypothetical protein
LLLSTAGRVKAELAADDVTGTAFSSSGEWLSVTTSVNTRLWNMARVEEQSDPLPAGQSYVEQFQAAFSQDDRYIAVSSNEQSSSELTVWSVSSKELVGAIPTGGGEGDFAFTSDGAEIIVASTGVESFTYRASSAMLRVCELLGGRNLSRAEWKQYAPGASYVAPC